VIQNQPNNIVFDVTRPSVKVHCRPIVNKGNDMKYYGVSLKVLCSYTRKY
jgi:hypothetical protein